MTGETVRRTSVFSAPDAAVVAGGAACGVLVCIAAGLLLWSQVRNAIRDDLVTLGLTARMIEEQASRTVDTTAALLNAVADSVGAQLEAGDTAKLGTQFADALRAQPDLRGLAVLDMDGKVLVTTESRGLGSTVDLSRLGALPAPGRVGLGPQVLARDLSGLAAQSETPAAAGFIPVVLRKPRLEGRAELLVVGLINPWSLAGYQQTLLESIAPAARSLLVDRSGHRLAGALQPADEPFMHSGAALQRLLQRGPQGTMEVRSDDGQTMLVGYRAGAFYPIVAFVEQPRWTSVRSGLEVLRWLLPACAGIIAAIAGLTVLGVRHMRARRRYDQEMMVAHERIEAGERRMQVLVASVQELLFRTDARGMVLFANPRWTEWGLVDGPVGRHLSSAVVDADRDGIGLLLHADGPDEARHARVRMQRDQDRPALVVDMSLTPLRRDGELIGFAGSAVDISDRIAAEKQAAARLRFLDLLQEIVPLPLCMTDRQGRFLTVNRAWEEFMGKARDDVIGLRNTDFLPPQEASAYDLHAQRLLHEGGRIHYEETLHLASGAVRHVRVSKVAVPGDDGEIVGLLAVKVDVTEIRRALAAAEGASRAKSEFVANISHELRTPLQSILGFSELGLLRSEKTSSLRLMFKDIHGSGLRMLELVNNLLDISKIESTVGTFRFAAKDLRACIESVAQELEPLLTRRRQQLRVDLPQEPLMASVDDIRIEQVIRNLVANAIKFSPEDGRIILHGFLDSPDGGPSDVVLRVQDEGPGIPATECELIFQPFMQSSATRPGHGGTGLGLAISRKIVNAHGGSISARNVRTGGAVFEVRLPAISARTPLVDSVDGVAS